MLRAARGVLLVEFNSWLYLFFLVVVATSYYFLNRRHSKNILLLVASYGFYAAWDWRFCSLILLSTVADFFVGQRIHASENEVIRRRFLVFSLTLNLGLLAVFKYFNFFSSSFQATLHTLGIPLDPFYANIILPIGISFYTFQTLSYTIDIYRRQLEPTKSFSSFALFVAFFPQLIAGPIERARNILPQLAANHEITKSHLWIGLQLILWGLFKKVFIADNIAIVVDNLFEQSAVLTFDLAYLAVLAFAIQIYADFSAYSDIARGSAKIFGIDLMQNFRNPYIATSPQDFWRRWHISLSTWLRDYLYIPLGGNRGGALLSYRNLFVTMVLGGLWHGAAWNYVLWGFYQGSLLAVHRWLTSVFRIRIPRILAMVIMFHFTLFGWMLFRSTRTVVVGGVPMDQSFSQIAEFISAWSRGLDLEADFWSAFAKIMLFGAPLFLFELLNSKHRLWHPLYFRSRPVSIVICALMLFLVVRYGVQNANSFIYFQF